MNFFTKIRVTSWIIGLLVLLNVLTLGVLWFQQFRRPPGMFPPPGKQAENSQRFLQRDLNLTEQQAQQFETLRNQYFLKSRTIMQEIHQLRKGITDELFSASPDAQKANKFAEEIGAKQAELERLLFNHFLELKAVCQPEQQKKFQALMRDLLEMMKPPEPPRPPEGVRPGEPPRGPDERGAQAPGRPSDLPPREPPREVVDACNGKQQGETCQIVTPHGDTLTGTCQSIQNQVACVPEGVPPGRSPDAPPDRP